jgi:hypothetical protein
VVEVMLTVEQASRLACLLDLHPGYEDIAQALEQACDLESRREQARLRYLSRSITPPSPE